MLKVIPLLVTALSLMLAAGPAHAHATLLNSIPANGATVSEPKTLTLTFTSELRLVTVRLTADGFDEALDVDRSAAAAKIFSIPLPALGAAKYTVKWRAAAADGHIMTGSFAFTVAAKTDQPAKP